MSTDNEPNKPSLRKRTLYILRSFLLGLLSDLLHLIIGIIIAYYLLILLLNLGFYT